jgi:hypothetical protein
MDIAKLLLLMSILRMSVIRIFLEQQLEEILPSEAAYTFGIGISCQPSASGNVISNRLSFGCYIAMGTRYNYEN